MSGSVPPDEEHAQTRRYERPFRVFQTNIREIDAGMDVEAVADDIVGFGANTWLLNTAGLVAFYPSGLPFARPSRWLRERASGDLIGDALAAAQARGLNLLARCDFSNWFYAIIIYRDMSYHSRRRAGSSRGIVGASNGWSR